MRPVFRIRSLRATGAGLIWRVYTSAVTGKDRVGSLATAEKVAERLGRDDRDTMSVVIVELRDGKVRIARWYDRAGDRLVRNREREDGRGKSDPGGAGRHAPLTG